jgi:hypothetical protein
MGGGRRQICLPRERGGEHHCPAGSSAKIASAFNHPQSPLLAQVSVRGGAVIWPLPVEYRTWWIANRATSRYIVKGSTAVMRGSGLLGQDLAAGLGRERDDQQADGECDRGEGDWRAESAHGSHGPG